MGGRTAFKRTGVTYQLPTADHTKNDYLEALRASGMTILEVAESLVGEMPEGYLPEKMWRTYARTQVEGTGNRRSRIFTFSGGLGYRSSLAVKSRAGPTRVRLPGTRFGSTRLGHKLFVGNQQSS